MKKKELFKEVGLEVINVKEDTLEEVYCLLENLGYRWNGSEEADNMERIDEYAPIKGFVLYKEGVVCWSDTKASNGLSIKKFCKKIDSIIEKHKRQKR